MEITPETIFTQSSELCDDLVAFRELRRKLVRLGVYAIVSTALYGTTMGAYHSFTQAAVSAVKVPALFLLTLVICLPTLHFVGLLFGSPVRFGQSLAVLMTGICQTSILLGAFAPISLFFLASRSEYSFLLIMHVVIFAFCGFAGLASVYKNFEFIRTAVSERYAPGFAGHLLKAWMLLYMFVGTQMAYNLAPFINRPGRPVSVFNQLNGNFYSYLWDVIVESLSR